MKVIDITEEHKQLYFACLEDWSEEMKEAGDHKETWYNKMKDKGLSVKLAIDDNGEVGEMIQYVPIEHSFVEGSDLYFIKCIWVHGYKKGRGNFQKRGMGKALLQAAETDARANGAKGIVAWDMSLPFWMKADTSKCVIHHCRLSMTPQFNGCWRVILPSAGRPCVIWWVQITSLWSANATWLAARDGELGCLPTKSHQGCGVGDCILQSGYRQPTRCFCSAA